jgi:hypothetical protein
MRKMIGAMGAALALFGTGAAAQPFGGEGSAAGTRSGHFGTISFGVLLAPSRFPQADADCDRAPGGSGREENARP